MSRDAPPLLTQAVAGDDAYLFSDSDEDEMGPTTLSFDDGGGSDIDSDVMDDAEFERYVRQRGLDQPQSGFGGGSGGASPIGDARSGRSSAASARRNDSSGEEDMEDEVYHSDSPLMVERVASPLQLLEGDEPPAEETQEETQTVIPPSDVEMHDGWEPPLAQCTKSYTDRVRSQSSFRPVSDVRPPRAIEIEEVPDSPTTRNDVMEQISDADSPVPLPRRDTSEEHATGAASSRPHAGALAGTLAPAPLPAHSTRPPPIAPVSQVDSIDLTEDSPPVSPSQAAWADAYMRREFAGGEAKTPSIFATGPTASATTTKVTPTATTTTTTQSATPSVSPFTAPVPSAFRSSAATAAPDASSTRTLSAALGQSSHLPSPSAAAPSSLFSRVNRPLNGPPTAAVPEPEPDVDFNVIFAAQQTPFTASVLSGERRSNQQFMRKPVNFSQPGNSAAEAAAAATSSFIAAAASTPRAMPPAPPIRSPSPRSEFFRDAIDASHAPTADAQVAALLHSDGPPPKRPKVSINGWLGRKTPPATANDDGAASAASSTTPTRSTHRKPFTKQELVKRLEPRKAQFAQTQSRNRAVSPASAHRHFDDDHDAFDDEADVDADPMDTDEAFSRAIDHDLMSRMATASDAMPSSRRHLPVPFRQPRLEPPSSSSHPHRLDKRHATKNSHSKNEIRRQMDAEAMKKRRFAESSAASSSSAVAAPAPPPRPSHGADFVEVSSAIGAVPRPAPAAMAFAPRRTTEEMIEAFKNKAAATGLGAAGGERKLKQLEPAMTERQRQANRTQQAELAQRKAEKASAANKSQRLYPNLSDLHRELLVWRPSEIGATVAKQIQSRLKQVPSAFDGVEHYQRVMFPLLVEECRAGLESQMDELSDAQRASQVGLNNRSSESTAARSVDATTVSAAITVNKTEAKGQITSIIADVRLGAASSTAAAASSSAHAAAAGRQSRSPQSDNFGHDDLVLLWPRDDLIGADDDDALASCWSDAPFAIFGLLQSTDVKQGPGAGATVDSSHAAAAAAATTSAKVDQPPFKLQLYFDSSDPNSGKALRNLRQGAHWLMCRVQNLRTLHREYSALASCDQIQLTPRILKPARTKAATPSTAAAAPQKEPTDDMVLAGLPKPATVDRLLPVLPSTIAARFNDAQRRSIATALTNTSGFTLVQGPPGTGKTSTIVGLVNLLYLQHQARQFLRGHPSSYRPTAGALQRQMSQTSRAALTRSSSNVKSKQFRLLICAPSNAAIDEIIDRLEGALLDQAGEKLNLNIVRLGAGNRKNAMPHGANRNVNSAAMPFHLRVSLDQLVRNRMAERELNAASAGDTADPFARPNDSSDASSIRLTASQALRQKAAAAVTAVRESQRESKDLHDRIADLERKMEAEDEEDRARAQLRQTGAPVPDRTTPPVDYQAELDKLNLQKKAVLQRKSGQMRVLDDLKHRERIDRRSALSPREQLQADLVTSAHIVCTTLSGAGLDFFRNLELDFPTVIIDESAQSSEVQTLIPLKYNVKRCILVGDPNQLSATVQSKVAAKYAYSQSLFERLQNSDPDAVELLNLQYRMHWEIARWPSQMFYQNRLKTAPERCVALQAVRHLSEISARARPEAAAAALPPSVQRIDLRLAPYAFYDVTHGEERSGRGASKSNPAEVEVAVQLFLFLRRAWEASNRDSAARDPLAFVRSVGIISPYSQQVSDLRRAFARRLTAAELPHLEIDSVDSFQGREKEFILFSVVRAGGVHGIGFVKDQARLNVALTRAKQGLYVIGRAETLKQDETWWQLLVDAHRRKRIITVRREGNVFDAKLGHETKYIRDMEPCPYTPAELDQTAARKSSGANGPTSAVAASKKVSPPALVGSATSSAAPKVPTAAAAASTAASPAVPLGPVALDRTVPVIDTVIKKKQPKTASPFLETRTAKQPTVPIEQTLKKMGVGGKPTATMIPLGRPTTTTTQGPQAAKTSNPAATAAADKKLPPKPVAPSSASRALTAAAGTTSASATSIRTAAKPSPTQAASAPATTPTTAHGNNMPLAPASTGKPDQRAQATQQSLPSSRGVTPPPSAAAPRPLPTTADASAAAASSAVRKASPKPASKPPPKPSSTKVASKKSTAEKEEGECTSTDSDSSSDSSGTDSSDSDDTSDDEDLLPQGTRVAAAARAAAAARPRAVTPTGATSARPPNATGSSRQTTTTPPPPPPSQPRAAPAPAPVPSRPGFARRTGAPSTTAAQPSTGTGDRDRPHTTR